MNMPDSRAQREPRLLRFTVFQNANDVVLAFSEAGPFLAATFPSEGGVHYPSREALIEALDKVELPGDDIVNRPSARVYSVTSHQLCELQAAA